MKLLLVALVSLACVPALALVSFAQRGYFALGGEYLLPILPLVIYGLAKEDD